VTLFVGTADGLIRQSAGRVAGLAAAMIAAAALIGWRAELPALSSWGSGFAAVNPVVAVCLAAIGVTLAYPDKDPRFAFAVGLAVAVLAALGLGAVLFEVELGIDRWLAGPGAASFRVTNTAMLALGLAGGSLALSRFEPYGLTATVLAGIAGAIAVFALLGYLTGIDTLYGSASIRSPPLPTTVGLLCVAGGIILRSGTMPTLRKPRPSWHLLVMLGCAIIAPLLLFGVYAGVGIGDAQFDEVRKELRSEARTLSAEVDREIIGEIGRLEALAASPSLRQGDFASFQRQAEASLALHQSGNIVLVDRDMHQLVNTWAPLGTPLEKAAVAEPTQRALATGKPQVTGLFMGPVVKQFMFGIVVPVEIDGDSRYALVRSPDQDTLERLVAANELPAGWHSVVSDAAHHIMAESQPEDAFIGQELPPSQWHRAGPDGVFEFVDSKGRSSLEAYARSELTGWEIAVWEPMARLAAPVRALWWTIGLTALLAFTLVVALASWLGRIIAHAVGQAARAALASGEGGPLSPGGTPVAEVNALMAELRGTTDLLRESERQLRLVTDNAPVAISHLDTEARYKFVNRYVAERQGLSPEQLIGKRISEVIGEKAFAIVEPYIRICLAGKKAEFEVEVPDRADEPQFVHCRFAPECRDGKVVGLVSATINITGLKRAEADLKASKDRLQLALNAAQLGSYQYDPRHLVFSGDARAQEIFDLADNQAAKEEIMKLVHPDDLERVSAALQAALDPVDPRRSATEFRLRRRDGEVRWVETLGLAYYEGDGPERRAVSFVGTVQDITERKKREEERREREEKEHLLMREINHRAKNMLSVVDAIAHQTVASNPEDFVERFSERIQALSANQDLLVRNEWQGVDVEELVHAQLAHFAGLIGSRIAAHGPQLRLRAASAQAIGLALHELATNAGKYGALSTDTGRVDVCWGIDGDTLVMCWTEREGPPVSAPKQRGFGTIVMETMTERSVDGKVDLDYAPSGLIWRLTCPAANALEPWEREQISRQGENRTALTRQGTDAGTPSAARPPLHSTVAANADSN
jgi:PAS domain S-box-containing protein